MRTTADTGVRESISELQRSIVLAYFRNESWQTTAPLFDETASALQRQLGDPVPVIISDVARILSIQIDFRYDRDDACGSLSPCQSGFRMRVNVKHRLRARFTAAHECGHSLLYDSSPVP